MARKEYYQFDQYVHEAKAPDFVLRVSDDEEVRITNPTGGRIATIARGMRDGDLDAVLLGLTGDAYPRISELLSTVGHKALPALVEDIMEHFGMYEDQELIGPGGGKVKASRPTEIQRLLKAGYRFPEH